MPAYTYILECSDGTFYTGWTNDLESRIASHNRGTGAKYTRGRGPVKLVYKEEHADYRTAKQREYAIKRLTKKQKADLISAF